MEFRLVPLYADRSEVPEGCYLCNVRLTEIQVEFLAERCKGDCIRCPHYVKVDGEFVCALPSLPIEFDACQSSKADFELADSLGLIK